MDEALLTKDIVENIKRNIDKYGIRVERAIEEEMFTLGGSLEYSLTYDEELDTMYVNFKRELSGTEPLGEGFHIKTGIHTNQITGLVIENYYHRRKDKSRLVE